MHKLHYRRRIVHFTDFHAQLALKLLLGYDKKRNTEEGNKNREKKEGNAHVGYNFYNDTQKIPQA